MHAIQLSRRELLLTSAGILLSSRIRPSWGQVTAEPKLIFRDPHNAEPELNELVSDWITPTSQFFIRSHAPNPTLDASSFRLRVEGLVRNPRTLSLADLHQYAQRTVTATLTCAGNRRAEFNRDGKVGGVQWQAGAIGNATWGGFPLAAVLAGAELLENAKHVWFEGLDEVTEDGATFPFGGSIPLEKAMIPQGPEATLLANRMNGEPLTPDHGFPLRAVVPGYIGARSVKWLGRIVVSDRPSPNHYLATAYKLVTQTNALDWAEAGPIYRYPLNAAICTPDRDAIVPEGPVTVTGYALPSGRPGSRITQVSVSADGGKTWTNAEFTGNEADFCWQLWSASVTVTADTEQLIAKATDSSGAFMPARTPWNAKGYLQNSWYRTPIRVSA